VFGITVPLAPPQRATQADGEDDGDSLLKHRIIWLVQDNAHLREKTASMLRTWGCEICEWAKADEALGASSPEPDVILVDGQWEPILALLKHSKDDRRPPMVAFLGKDDAGLRDALRQAGVHTTNLPVSPARLRAMLTQLLLGS